MLHLSKNKKLITTLTFLFIIFLFSCQNKEKDSDIIKDSTLNEIKKRGKLIASTECNSTNYFIYKGQAMGYQYELLKLLAKHLDVKLELIVSNDLEENFKWLLDKKSDLIALDLTVTKERSKIVDFTKPYSQTRQVLVQRKYNLAGQKMSKNHLIRSQLDLAGKEIYIQKKSSFSERLRNLSEEIGDSIHIIESSEYDEEQLILLVAKGEIDYTVCDEHIALVNKTYYPNIDIKTPVSFHQNLAWALRKNQDSLMLVINDWMTDLKKTRKYKVIYNKYFKNKRSVQIVNSEFYSIKGGKISPYDDYLKRYSKLINWDWRLLASLMFQESGFDPKAKSWAEAYGLMQLMPLTAQEYGIDTLSLPEENILAGVKFIRHLDKQLSDKIDYRQERIKFILASYNAGLGHILDARRLAKKYDKNPDVWSDNVDFFLLKKSNRKFYTDPVVRYGYCRGTETYKFVNEILERYQNYKNIVKE